MVGWITNTWYSCFCCHGKLRCLRGVLQKTTLQNYENYYSLDTVADCCLARLIYVVLIYIPQFVFSVNVVCPLLLPRSICSISSVTYCVYVWPFRTLKSRSNSCLSIFVIFSSSTSVRCYFITFQPNLLGLLFRRNMLVSLQYLKPTRGSYHVWPAVHCFCLIARGMGQKLFPSFCYFVE